MKQQSFEMRLKELIAPAPDPSARLEAKRAALAEFARVHAIGEKPEQPQQWSFKALLSSLRLTRAKQQGGRSPMALSTRSALFGTAASFLVASLALIIMWPTITQQLAPSVSESISVPHQRTAAPRKETEPAPSELPDIEPVVVIDLTRTPQVPAPELIIQMPEAPPSPSAIRQTTTARASNRSEEIVVSGYRGSLENGLALSRSADSVDSITAENIGRSPDRYAVSNLQRIPGATLPARARPPASGDKFEHFDTASVMRVADVPVSTFSIDVDTASYSYVRRQLQDGVLPQKNAVRVEEMINYFDYVWPAPRSAKQPFRPTVIVSDSPWGEGKKLVHIGIQGYELRSKEQPAVNLVMLLDVSGSMNEPDKLPLVKQSMRLLVSSLKPTDTVAIVVYAGAAGAVLEPTEVREETKILSALEKLSAGGSTAGADGIKLAYQLAEANFRKDGVNRILLATDGDFNVGISDHEELKGFVERQRENGVFLSVLGFGQGNYRDELAQALAQNGNGVAAYIDTFNEARKVLVQEATASLFTIAKDVKLQVEFNPETVAEYRLIGYETRALKQEDFNNDAVDAGDIGAGHTVTAIYEITPVGSGGQMIDNSRYAPADGPRHAKGQLNEYGYLKIRYKLPDGSTSKLIEQPILVKNSRVSQALQREVQFSTAVAGFGQLLRGGTHTGSLTYEDVVKQAQSAKGDDPYGYRTELVNLVRSAQVAEEM